MTWLKMFLCGSWILTLVSSCPTLAAEPAPAPIEARAGASIAMNSAVGLVTEGTEAEGAPRKTQEIDFPPIPTQSAGFPLRLRARASSGLPVAFASSTGRVCATTGGTAAFLTAGRCVITATQAGDRLYAPAPPVVRVFWVQRSPTTTKPIVTSGVLSSIGKPLTLPISVFVSGEGPVNGGNVFISAGDYGSVTTGRVTNGAVKAAIMLPAGIATGTYPVKAFFSGSPQDSPSEGTTTFTVVRPSTAAPNVVGLSRPEAVAAITKAGLVVGMVTTQASNSVPTGDIVSEAPVAGARVALGSPINLVLSSGPATVAVPNVVGKSQAAATAAIIGAGFRVGTITQAGSTSVAVGNVIRENPAAGTAVPIGSAVNLVLSSSFTALIATMTTARAFHTATLLPSGQVLLTGGCGNDCTNGNGVSLDTAEQYNPTANTFTALSVTMTAGRFGHTATLLANGQVLLAGGCEANCTRSSSTSVDTAELFDPISNAFTALSATMTTTRQGHTATLLPNGLVLMTGGYNAAAAVLDTAELYDPVAKTFTAITARMTVPRHNHTGTLLPNGQVLLTGGLTNSGGFLNTAELYDPVANTFTALAAAMITARAGHTGTPLPNGQVLLTGGLTSPDPFLATAEMYDPVANTFTNLTATMTTVRAGHTGTLLPSGQVLITGGIMTLTGPALNSAEAYQALPPPVQTFKAIGATMTTARGGHTATLLRNGQVLLAGGCAAIPCTDLDTAELYNPVTGTFTALGVTMTVGREGATATLLPSGKVLIAGGAPNAGSGSAPFATAELYDPVANTFSALGAQMTEPRFGHTATLLPNGKVLITGGYSNESPGDPNLPVTWNNAELYDPVADTFTAITPVMTVGRAQHTATLLSNGTVLIAGGTCEAPNAGVASSCNDPALLPFQSVYFDTAEVYDPVANSFTSLDATMTSIRNAQTATMLPDGQVLLAGGILGKFGSAPVLDTAELYNPTTGVFTALASTMSSGRASHTATLLPDGEVLLAGGIVNNTPLIANTAELYSP